MNILAWVAMAMIPQVAKAEVVDQELVLVVKVEPLLQRLTIKVIYLQMVLSLDQLLAEIVVTIVVFTQLLHLDPCQITKLRQVYNELCVCTLVLF